VQEVSENRSRSCDRRPTKQAKPAVAPNKGEGSMTRGKLTVEWKPEDKSRLPDELSSSAIVLLKLRDEGLLEEAAERLKVRRQGGYSAMALWVALLIYMASKSVRGIRPSWESWGGKTLDSLAAIGELRSCPRAASLSRGLSAFEFKLLRPVTPWLLPELPQINEVLRHPTVLSLDAKGQGWHIFDLAPTATVLRERGLPRGDELPEPLPLAERVGAPGHQGRKRGELTFRQNSVQHSGSSLWIHSQLSKGNGEGVLDLERSLDAVVMTCQRLEHPSSHVLLRMDGEFGNIGSYTACRERGLGFMTRLNHHSLYKEPEVLAKMREGKWEAVQGSRSGPQRYAMDLGVLLIKPSPKTAHPDGTPYAPIQMRAVASVYARYRDKKLCGRLLDSLQVELFAVDVPADAWPASESVAAYFGRAAQENRFAQEDREKKLDRIISYHLPGQELAILTGLSVWNLEVVEGFKLARPQGELTPQRLHVEHNQQVDIISSQWPRDPVLKDLLAKLDWPQLLQGRDGWSWDPDEGLLHCPEGRPMQLTSVAHSRRWSPRDPLSSPTRRL